MENLLGRRWYKLAVDNGVVVTIPGFEAKLEVISSSSASTTKLAWECPGVRNVKAPIPGREAISQVEEEGARGDACTAAISLLEAAYCCCTAVPWYTRGTAVRTRPEGDGRFRNGHHFGQAMVGASS